MKTIRRVVSGGALILLGAAVAQELALPPAQRTWHGAIADVVPYDFRLPTWARVKQTLWNPDGKLVVGQVFGIGWTLNVGRLARLVGLV